MRAYMIRRMRDPTNRKPAGSAGEEAVFFVTAWLPGAI
jgi:hypothetical protein